ncbi:MAG: septum formation initiator family protein [Acidobacteriota bacterium]|nr:septum formation initiator family protein [Acidobacteriota bacterium]
MVSIRIVGGWLYATRRVLATVCIGLLAVGIGYKVVFGANGMRVWQSKRAEYEKLQLDIEKESATHEQIRHRVDGLQRADPTFIEKVAREQLGYVKPGETVLYEQAPKLAPKPAAAVSETQAQK